MKKLVLKVSLITVAAILVLLGIVYGCFSLFAPHLLGSLFERVGANNASLYFYEKEYNKNQNTSNLYRVLNKAIIFENNPKIVEYFEKFYALENYEQNIETINEANYNANGSVLENVSLSNADNRLKSRYAKALCSGGNFEKAFEFAKVDLTTFDDTNINFVFSGLVDFVNAENGDMFDNEKIGTKTVAESIYNYYQQVKVLYENSKTANKDKFTLATLANKLLVIADFMDTIKEFSTNEVYNDANFAVITNYAQELRVALATYVG